MLACGGECCCFPACFSRQRAVAHSGFCSIAVLWLVSQDEAKEKKDKDDVKEDKESGKDGDSGKEGDKGKDGSSSSSGGAGKKDESGKH